MLLFGGGCRGAPWAFGVAGPWIGAWPVSVSRGARGYCQASRKLSEISVSVENGLSGMSVATVPEWASVRHMDMSSESLPQVHFPIFSMSVRWAAFASTVSPGPWAATKKSPFEFL